MVQETWLSGGEYSGKCTYEADLMTKLWRERLSFEKALVFVKKILLYFQLAFGRKREQFNKLPFLDKTKKHHEKFDHFWNAFHFSSSSCVAKQLYVQRWISRVKIIANINKVMQRNESTDRVLLKVLKCDILYDSIHKEWP